MKVKTFSNSLNKILISSLFLLLASCSQSANILDEGHKHYDEGKYKESLEKYSQAVKEDPKNAEAYFYKGLAEEKTDDYKGALVDYDKAIELKPKEADYYNNRAVIKGLTDNFKGAVDDLDEAIKLNDKEPEYYMNRGINKSGLNQLAQATEDLDKAIELKADYADAYFNRGVLYGKIEALDKAMEDFKKAKELYEAQKNKEGIKSAEEFIANVTAMQQSSGKTTSRNEAKSESKEAEVQEKGKN
ncbi:MAG: tetratricopeptide repeat protein [Candidatus Caenarcaniphilales bacterium]|nr:tetratricopeptide repeat protein [Candidatus Caenarcaniphilales bacterium]